MAPDMGLTGKPGSWAGASADDMSPLEDTGLTRRPVSWADVSAETTLEFDSTLPVDFNPNNDEIWRRLSLLTYAQLSSLSGEMASEVDWLQSGVPCVKQEPIVQKPKRVTATAFPPLTPRGLGGSRIGHGKGQERAREGTGHGSSRTGAETSPGLLLSVAPSVRRLLLSPRHRLRQHRHGRQQTTTHGPSVTRAPDARFSITRTPLPPGA